MAERCPDCGFDLEGTEICAVCGHGAEGRESRAARSPIAAFLAFALPFACGLALIAASLGFYLWLTASPKTIGVAAIEARSPSQDPQPAALAAVQPHGAAAAEAPAPPMPASLAEAGKLAAQGAAAPLEEPRAKNLPPSSDSKRYIAWMLAHTGETSDQLAKKWIRAQAIIGRKYLTNPAVLAAFLYAPREYFVRSYNVKKAYDDTAIPIGHGQTISGPNMVSAMTNAIAPRPSDRILEIGTGSGYQSSVLAELSDYVYTIEIVAPLYKETDAIYKSLEKSYPEYKNIVRLRGDGYFGLPEHAPFQKIIVTAGIDHIPPPLLRQLAPGGIMVIPVGPPSGQTILKIVKVPSPDGGFTFTRQDIYHGKKVVFVPFTSDKGVHSLKDTSGGSQ